MVTKTVTYDGEYTIETYTGPGVTTWVRPPGVTFIRILIIAGGGGGGLGSGGGAGGVIDDSGTVNSDYYLAIGAGGHGVSFGGYTSPAKGGNSVFGTITAIGGGFGSNDVVSEEVWGAEPFDTPYNPIGGGGLYSGVVTYGTNPTPITTKSGLLSALSGATSGQTIFVSGTAVIDLTGEAPITIPAGVTLASNRGYGGSLGARIYRTTGYGSNTNTFVAGGANVRLTGIRLEGAWGVEYSTNSWFTGFNSAGYTGTVVDNCDISKWNRAVVHEPGASSTNTLYVHNCNIHQNNNDGYGYGVSCGGGVSIIERCIFQYNRHSVAGSGVTGEEYEARYNMEYGGFTSGAARAGWHNFDCHAILGVAGKKQYIHHNTFVNAPTAAQATPHIDIEGAASTGTYIDHNKFFQTWYPTYEPVYAHGGTTRFYATSNYWNGTLYAVDGVVQYG